VSREKKASELIAQPGAISAAPGYGQECKMVMSKTGKRPHLVTSSKANGRFFCDADCPNYKAICICSHTVAVAQLNNSLQQFCDYYRKSKHLPSVTQLLLSGVPSGVGNKGNRVSKKRKREEVTSRTSFETSNITTQNKEIVGQSTSFNNSDVSDFPSAISQYHPYIPGCFPSPCNLYPTQQPIAQYHHSQHSPSPSYLYSLPSQQPHSPSPYLSYQGSNFRLWFRKGNISTCNGCRNKFDKNSVAPYDLCVQHAEWRCFTSPSTSLPDSRFGNAYYHLSVQCIQVRWPSFRPTDLLIDDSVRVKLLQVHKDLISNTFGIII
jgi:hypothetical protein